MIFKSVINLFSFANFPRQMKFIMWNEAVERYAYYGMRTILVVYVAHYLKISDNIAAATFSYFAAFCYLTPLFGAYLADKYLGKYKTILICSFIYSIGFITLSFWNTFNGLVVSLFLIGIGTGGIKPCIGTFMADQIDSSLPDADRKRIEAFNLLYFMVNFGSLFATFLAPITRAIFGPQVAFLIPGILMMISIVIFVMGRKYYVHVDHSKESHPPLWKIIICGLKNIGNREKGSKTILSGAFKFYSKEDVYCTHNVLQILKIFAFMIVFFSVLDQQSSSWVLQSMKLNNVFLFGTHIPPEIIQMTNPLLILLFIPLFNSYLYPWLDRKIKLTAFKKVFIGIILAGIAFCMVGVIQSLLDSGLKLHLLWQVIPYATITVAEIFIIITVMEFTYAQAPNNMKAIMMSFFWLSVFLGDTLAGIILQLGIFHGASLFFNFGVLCFVCAVIFIPIVRSYKHINY